MLPLKSQLKLGTINVYLCKCLTLKFLLFSVDEIDEEDGDEIYNRTTTTINQGQNQNQPQPGPSRNQSSEHLLYGIDNQGLDTDFNSVFENIQIKHPQGSLI